MKVYVFGGDKDACIELANQLNSSGASAIIAKEGDALKDVAGRIGKAFDRAVMVSEDPIRDSITANRDVRVKAAVCSNQKSLKAAASADVNLFILEKDAYDRLDLTDILGAASRQQPIREREEPPKREQKRQPPPPEPRQQEQRESRGGGVGSRLKNIFGIVEE